MTTTKENATKHIVVTPSIKKTLDSMKDHPRQPYHEVISNLIECCKKYTSLHKQEE